MVVVLLLVLLLHVWFVLGDTYVPSGWCVCREPAVEALASESSEPMPRLEGSTKPGGSATLRYALLSQRRMKPVRTPMTARRTDANTMVCCYCC